MEKSILPSRKVERVGLRSVLKCNTYLTDESRLFRCLGWDDLLVLLEDCVTLEVFAYPGDDLALTDMRLVKPARKSCGGERVEPSIG